MATFALRRVMTIDDAAQIKTIAQPSKKDGYLQTPHDHRESGAVGMIPETLIRRTRTASAELCGLGKDEKKRVTIARPDHWHAKMPINALNKARTSPTKSR